MDENRQLIAVQAFVAQLFVSGVREVCISPGSRSTPLTMAFVRHGGFRVWSILDERSAGFFAVGLARAQGKPAVLVCTSGTATGNYLPAMMEAFNARLPLIAVTADRPPELYGTGANQTVEQTHLYGSLVKWHHQMPVPDESQVLVRHAVLTAARAVVAAGSTPAGPVHVNWPFREPLIIPEEPFALGETAPTAAVNVWSGGTSAAAVGEEQWVRLARWLREQPRGLLVCGPCTQTGWAEAVVDLAQAYDWPILADPLSQLRSGSHAKTHVVDTYDAMLRSSFFRNRAEPSLIVRMGGAMTSKSVNQYLTHYGNVPQVVVDEAQLWTDATLTATDVVPASPIEFCEAMVACRQGEVVPDSQRTWLFWWQEANRFAKMEIQRQLATTGKAPSQSSDGRSEQSGTAVPQEGQLVQEVLTLVPANSNVFVGNSMPIRDFDSFMANTDKPLTLYANRGVSGIDGVVSTALGVAAGTARPTVLVIGDVSFYHDMNGLLTATRHGLDLLVVIINNNGGGIFSFLPQARYPDTFHQFRTEHGLSYEAMEQLYGARYKAVTTVGELHESLTGLVRESGLRLLEVFVDTQANVAEHRRIFAAVEGIMEDFCSKDDGPWRR